MQIGGTLQQGREAKARYAYEQKVQQAQADEAEAASQRDAAQRYREGRLIESQQRAAIAGSGGDLTDPSVIDLMDDTKDQVIYAADSDIFKGKQQAAGYNDAAKISKINGDNAMKAAQISAGAQLFGGISNMFSRFGAPAKKQQAPSVQLPYGYR
ncbi:hypothetical protein J2X76_003684 [Neorhizobium sp. 2083]|uniref:hypothetical protein n=1 Tax=Neorhizobium sp. 2083 TaxID=2817762 RepID=UPI002861D369|nr:hypothetical protein [Neorhizobium sp. 2083]MDR6818507.1 hypothetical protein [Neorhizobium sp. 2083]